VEVVSYLEVLFDGGEGGAGQLDISPDGAQVYVAGGKSLITYRRELISGLLSVIGVQRSGLGGASGFDCVANTVAAGPDGFQVYLGAQAGFCSSVSLAAFTRQPANGSLTFVDVKLDFSQGVGRFAESIAVSPDSSHVYVAGFFDNAVSVFQRNVLTGGLEFLEASVDGAGGVDGLAGVRGISVSPNGAQVYGVAQNDRAVATFRRDPGNGRLSFTESQVGGVGGIDGLDFPNAIAVTPDAENVYVSGGQDAIVGFERDLATGVLTYQQTYRNGTAGITGMTGPISIEVSPEGSNVYVGGSSESTIVVFDRNAQGELQYLETERNGVGGVVDLAFPRSLAASPDGKHFYATGNSSAVVVFARDADTGLLSFAESERQILSGIDGLNGAGAVTASPNGEYVYVTGVDDQALGVFRRDSVTGRLAFLQGIRDGVDGADGLGGPRGVVVSPDGQHVYVAGSADDAVAILRREAGVGVLTFQGMIRDGIDGVDGLNGARGLAASDDGKHIYVAGPFDNAVAVLARNLQTGELGFVEAERDGVAGVDGLDLARAVALCPGGAHLYAVGEVDDAVAVFARDSISGAITFLELKRDGVGGVDGLDGASAVTCSSDGAHVYVTARFDDAVAVFQRNQQSGLLTFVEAERDEVGGATGLNEASAVAVSPGGAHVLVAGTVDDAVAVFARNPVSGALTPVEVRINSPQFVYDGPSAIAFSPDSRQVYVAGQDSDSLAMFSFNR
jgi:6-phosphogluconolactonase (cycloisomerase 2 family)